MSITWQTLMPGLTVFVFVTLLIFAVSPGMACSGEEAANCSYWYSLVPSAELNCNPIGVDVSLVCAVYVPCDPSTTVRWYKGGSPQDENGTLVVSGGSDQYELKSTLGNSPVPNGEFTGLFYDQYVLIVSNFSASDTGYYWCQIEITNSTGCLLPLLPSQSAYRASRPGQSACTSGLKSFDLLDAGICAIYLAPFSTSITVLHLTPSPSSSSFPEIVVSVQSQTGHVQAVTTLNPSNTVLPPSDSKPSDTVVVFIAVGVGGGAGVITILFIVFIVMILCARSKTRKRKDDGNGYTEEEAGNQSAFALREIKENKQPASTVSHSIATSAEKEATEHVFYHELENKHIISGSHPNNNNNNDNDTPYYTVIHNNPSEITPNQERMYSEPGISPRLVSRSPDMEPKYDEPVLKSEKQRPVEATVPYSYAYCAPNSAEAQSSPYPAGHMNEGV